MGLRTFVGMGRGWATKDCPSLALKVPPPPDRLVVCWRASPSIPSLQPWDPFSGAAKQSALLSWQAL